MKKQLLLWLCVISLLVCSMSGCALNLGGFNPVSSEPDSGSGPADTTSADTTSSEINSAPSLEQTGFADAKSLYITGTPDPIAMRESDDDTSNVVAQLVLGDEVKLLSADSPTHYCVFYPDSGKQGYVKKMYLTEERSAVCKGEEFYTSKQTAFYDSNDEGRREVEKLPAGTALIVIAKTPGDCWFVNVKDTKNYGYVTCIDLTGTKPTTSSKTTSSKTTSSKTTSSKTTSSQPSVPKTTTSSTTNNYPTGYGSAPANYSVYYAKVNSGYLGLRSYADRANDTNIIAQMYTGCVVYVVDKSTGTYWYCYCPDVGMYGFADSRYLTTTNPGSGGNQNTSGDYTVWTVKVNSGYLALRWTAARADDTNIMGQLYTGDVVYVYSYSYQNFSDRYWYVYAPSLSAWGYVDSNYIWSN